MVVVRGSGTLQWGWYIGPIVSHRWRRWHWWCWPLVLEWREGLYWAQVPSVSEGDASRTVNPDEVLVVRPNFGHDACAVPTRRVWAGLVLDQYDGTGCQRWQGTSMPAENVDLPCKTHFQGLFLTRPRITPHRMNPWMFEDGL